MARIKYGPIIADISGSIGSATFQKSLYGNTLRNRPRNTRSATAPQLVARSIMMQCQYSWRALDPAVRRQWDQFIAFSGASINRDRGILMTGHSLYLKYNFARLLAGLAVFNTLNYKSAVAWPSISTLEAVGNHLYINASDDTNYDQIFLTFLISDNRSASLSFSKRGLRFLKCLPWSAPGSIVTYSYAAIFGINPTPGNIVHVQYQWWHLYAPILSALRTAIFTIE